MKKMDFEKEQKLLLNANPEGRNALSARAMFYQRILYEKQGFSRNFVANETQPLDLWYGRQMYGRENKKGETVHLSEAFLRQIDGTSDLFLVDFVTDAFEDLMQYYRLLKSRKVVCSTGNIQTLTPKRAFVNLQTSYHELATSYYGVFNSFVASRNADTKIKNFQSFVNVFLDFIGQTTPARPLTRSGYAKSRFATPLNTGLVVEMSKDAHDGDEKKITDWIDDVNFAVYAKAAHKYGFKVDKHAPWRLIANVDSPKMREYMEKRGTTPETFIDEYYYVSHQVDMMAIKVYMLQFYNTYVEDNPIIFENELIKGGTKTKIKQSYRYKEKMEDIDNSYPEDYWLRMYAFIRGRESNQPWNQVEFEKIVTNAYHLQKTLDKATAIRYIDERTRKGFRQKGTRDFNWISC